MKRFVVIASLVVLFGITRLFQLTLLPVFADEAIYVRWAQMMTHEPQKYAFLPLYDGKTPLFIWLLVPLLTLFTNPLLASRLLSVVAGLITAVLIARIVKASGSTKRAQIIAAVLTVILPFSLFHSRMGLIDMLLTLFLSGSYYFLIRWRADHSWRYAILTGIMWGLALLTKTSALFFALVPLGVWLLSKPSKKSTVQLIIGGIVGLGFLALLRVSPFFPFLFRRTSDFAFTPHEILTQLPQIVWSNLSRVRKWLWIYFTPGVWACIGLFLLLQKKLTASKQLQSSLLLHGISFVLFLIPFLVTGKLLASRYFLPTLIWIIPLAAIVLDSFFQKMKWIAIAFSAIILICSVRFAVPLLTNPGATPFSNEDVVQYLTEWSSGYGIPEVRDYVAKRAETTRVIVATEGYFGTLPDGLLMYFDRSPLIKNMEIFGVGTPNEISSALQAKTLEGEVYFLINEHRLQITPIPANMQLVGNYKRPRNGPALLLFRILP